MVKPVSKQITQPLTLQLLAMHDAAAPHVSEMCACQRKLCNQCIYIHHFGRCQAGGCWCRRCSPASEARLYSRSNCSAVACCSGDSWSSCGCGSADCCDRQSCRYSEYREYMRPVGWTFRASSNTVTTCLHDINIGLLAQHE